jgi:hypothetical protein
MRARGAAEHQSLRQVFVYWTLFPSICLEGRFEQEAEPPRTRAFLGRVE